MKSPQDIIDHYMKGVNSMKLGVELIVSDFEKEMLKSVDMEKEVRNKISIMLADEIMKHEEFTKCITLEKIEGDNFNWEPATKHRLNVHVFSEEQLTEYVQERIQSFVLINNISLGND